MNAPARPDSTPRLEDFPYRLTDNVRFADLDPNQHVNNAVYATYFETGRVTLMKDRSYGLMPQGLAWIMVRLDMHFRAELRWPGTIEMGLGVAKFGRTSVTFDQVVFSEGKCVASAQSVSVLIDESTRKPTPLTAEIISEFPALAAPRNRHRAAELEPREFWSQACRSGVDTTRPSSSSLTLIWHDSREFGRTSKPKSSMSSSIGDGAPTFSRQASST